MRGAKREKQLEQLIREKLIRRDKLPAGEGRARGRNYFIVVIKRPPILIGTAIYKSELHEMLNWNLLNLTFSEKLVRGGRGGHPHGFHSTCRYCE